MSIRPLPPDLQIKSESELNEKPNQIQEDLHHILDWIKQQPYLKARTDPQWLLSFLRGCKFSLQRTKEKLDMFYTMRTMLPEFFSNRDPLLPEIQEILKLGLCLPLPKTANPTAPKVIFLRPPVDWKIDFVLVLKTSIMIIDILLNEDDNFIIAGQRGFQDMKRITFNHMIPITPTICKKATVCLQHAYPTRPKGFHFTNVPSFFEGIFRILKPMTTEKIRNRFYVYGEDNFDYFKEGIPQFILPKEYGGESGTLDELTAYWKKKVESYRDWFLEDAQYCTNENMRPGKSYTYDEIFGVEGSFRKLHID